MVVKVPVFLICISNIGLESDKYPPRAQNPSDFINYLVHDYFRWKVLEEIACERHVYGIVTKKIQPLCRGQTERRASSETPAGDPSQTIVRRATEFRAKAGPTARIFGADSVTYATPGAASRGFAGRFGDLSSSDSSRENNRGR